MSCAAKELNTVAPSISASWTASGTAPEVATPSPQTMSGERAPARMAAASWIASGSGRARQQVRVAGAMTISAVSSMTLVGMEMKTGPRGGSAATLNARRRTVGMSAASCTSTAHLVSGSAMRTRSAASIASCTTPVGVCWPA